MTAPIEPSRSVAARARHLLHELRRRGVIGVAAVYVVVSWIVWQVADVVLPALGLPDWSLTLVVVLSTLGFPLAIVLGWAYDLAPDGVVRTAPLDERDTARSTEPSARERDRWERVQVHLQRLIEEPPGSRQRYLDRLGRVEPGLTSEVEALLAAHVSAGPLDSIMEWLNEERKGSDREPGTRVAQYRIGRRVGGGGMGVVYEAFDERLERRVALKFLASTISANEAAKTRFLVEARAAATLDHVNVCTILEVGEDSEGSLFLAMPYYEGETLRARIQRGPLPLDEALDIARQLAEGLGAAHRRGIVHRDIKPANVILTADGVAKIVDFGVAKVADAVLTRTGAMLGSLSYASPEQTRGEQVDARTDLWSLGVVLYEMVTGRRPFLGPDEHAIRTAILTSPHPPLRPERPEAESTVGPILERALSKDREGRYASTGELVADIDSIRASGMPRPAGLVRPVIEPGERRICTILSTRLEPYEQLIEEVGPAELRSVSQRIEAAIAEAVTAEGGSVLGSDGNRHTAAFGIPMTHEDDGRRALCACLAIRERIDEIGGELERELGLRVTSRTGVDSGFVVVRQKSETVGYDVSGRPLRVAQELARRAPDGEILITSECRRLAANSVEIGSQTAVDITGEDGLVTAHALVSAAAQASSLQARAARGLTTFRGRDDEMSLLTRLAGEAASDGGHLVQIVGEPGVGKSRLVLEFANGLADSPCRVLTGRALPVSRSTPYAPVTEILRQVLHPDSGAEGELEAEAVVERLLATGDELRESIPLILRILSLSHPDHPFPKDLSGEHVRVAIIEAVAGLFSLLAAERPLILVFEDWHWADDASTSALRQLAEVAPAFPILLIVTVRPGYGVELHGLPGLVTISLEPLGPRTSAALLSSVLGADAVEEALAGAIACRTGGNPFYIEEFGADLIEQGVVTVNDGTACLVERVDVRLPDSVQAVIRTRLDRIDASAKEILFTASVIGREFSRNLLDEVRGGPDGLDRALEAPQANGLVQQARMLPDPAYRFKHALTLEVTYESLLIHQRRTLHRRVADALVSRAPAGDEQFDVLAHHFASARAWAEAMPYGIEAARRSVELSENHDALAMLDRVTDEWAPHLEPSDDTDRLLKEALFMKERVLDGAGRRQAQQAVIDRLVSVVERVGDVRDQIELDMRQGDLYSTIRRYDEAERVLERVLERSRRTEDPEMQRKALRSLGMVWWYQDDGREAEVLKLLEEALELDLANEDTEAEIGDRANICTMLLAMGQVDRALEMAESLGALTRPGENKAAHLANYSFGRCYRALGKDELALEHFERAAALPAPDTNSSFALSHLAGMQVELGEPEKALETYGRIVYEARRHGHPDALAHTLKSSAGVLEGLGRSAEAIPLLEEAQQLFGRLQDRDAEAEVSAKLATLYRRTRRLQDAVAAWGTVRQLARRQGDASLELRALEGLAGATREHFGEDDLAVPLYEEASLLAESLDDREGAARVLNTLGVIGWNRGDLDAAREFYERALAAADAAGRVDDVVLILASLGAVHRKCGRLGEAVDVLQKAIEEGARKGAVPLLRGYALGVLGDVLLDMRDLRGAERAYSDSLDLRRALGDERGEAWMLVKLSDVEVRRGALDRVRELNSRAYDIASKLQDEELIRASTGRERY